MNLTCVSDCPGLDFPRESLYSQWEYLTWNAVQHPTWGSADQAFLVQQSMRPPLGASSGGCLGRSHSSTVAELGGAGLSLFFTRYLAWRRGGC